MPSPSPTMVNENKLVVLTLPHSGEGKKLVILTLSHPWEGKKFFSHGNPSLGR